VAVVVLEILKASYCVALESLSGCDLAVGPVKSGLVAKTKEPVPVSSVQALAIFADENVPNIVDTPVPNPLTPVEIGRPVQLVNVPDAGVPRIGVVELVINLPPVPENVATCPDVTVPPVLVTTLAEAIPLFVIVLDPFAEGKLPETKLVLAVIILVERIPESAITFPVVPEKLQRLVLTAEAGPVTIELTADTFEEPTKEPDKHASLKLLAVVPRSQRELTLRILDF